MLFNKIYLKNIYTKFKLITYLIFSLQIYYQNQDIKNKYYSKYLRNKFTNIIRFDSILS